MSDGQRIVICDRGSLAHGLRPGMTLAAASALLPHLRVARRDPEKEAAALLGVAAWAGQFTPNVALEPPATALMEISASLKLFKGLAALLQAQRTGLAQMGHAARLACAPTAKAASLLARAGREISVDDTRLEATLAALPITLLDCAQESLDALSNIGVRTIGELLALPRDGLASRFGRSLPEELDRLTGRIPDPRDWHVPPARFKAGIDLPAEVADAGMLLFAANRLILQLSGYLAGRSAGVQGFTVKLRHAEQRSTAIVIGLASPSRNAEHLMRLLRERLERTPLAEPARALLLEADEIRPLPPETLSLFHDATQAAGDRQRLLDTLRARLGNESVAGLAIKAEYRPEQASVAGEPGAKISGPAFAQFSARPLWLLPEPKALPEIDAAPQYRGPLKLLSGPERIESGWWDGKDVKRDYFVARTAADALVWIYRERQAEGRWYLHGLFA